MKSFDLGDNDCLNVFCTSNRSFIYDRKLLEDANHAAAESIKLCHDYGTSRLDEYVNSRLFVTESILEQIIERCRNTNDWTLYRDLIRNIFSDRQNLSSSFLRKGFMINISLEQRPTSAASATSKSKCFVEKIVNKKKILIMNVYFDILGQFLTDSRIETKNDEITLDLEQMKRSIKFLTTHEDEILQTMASALEKLFNQIDRELTNFKMEELESDAHFLNIFFIVFQLPYLSDPGFIFDIASKFYILLTKLSIDMQAKFVRVLAKRKENLSSYVAHVQQYITMQTVRWSDNVPLFSIQEPLLSFQKGKFIVDSIILNHKTKTIDID